MKIEGHFLRIEDEMRPLIRRGGLRVALNPVNVWLGATRIPLSPLEAAIMLLLVRKARASWAEIDGLLAGATAKQAVRSVLIHRIRRKFQAAGGGDPFDTARGWGLILRVPPDERQSTSLWIGERVRCEIVPDVQPGW